MIIAVLRLCSHDAFFVWVGWGVWVGWENCGSVVFFSVVFMKCSKNTFEKQHAFYHVSTRICNAGVASAIFTEKTQFINMFHL